MSSNILKYVARDLIYGWRPNEPAEAIAHQSWVDAQNVRFKGFGIQRILDSGQFGTQTLDSAVMHLAIYEDNNSSINGLAFTQKEIYKRQTHATSKWKTAEADRLGVRYTTGTVSCAASTTVTGVSTNWKTGDSGVLPKSGDKLLFTGADSLGNVITTWYEISTVVSDTQITLTAAPAYTWAGVAYEVRLLQTQSARIGYADATFHKPSSAGQSIYITSNGQDPPIKWDGTGNFSFLGGMDNLQGNLSLTSGMRFKSCTVWRNMLWAFNTIEDGVAYPFRLRCSNIADPETWYHTIAGSDYSNYWDDFMHGGDEGTAILPLSDGSLIVYKKNHVYRCSYVGLDLGIISITMVSSTAGAICKRAVASNGHMHCFCDAENIYLMTPESGIVPIGDPVRQYWKENLNPNCGDNVQVTWRADQGEFWITYTNTSGTDPDANEALVLHLPSAVDSIGGQLPPTWSRVTMANTTACGLVRYKSFLTWTELAALYTTWSGIPSGTRWADLCTEEARQYLWGDSSGKVYYFENDAGEATGLERTGVVQTKLHSFGDTYQSKLIRYGAFNTDASAIDVGWYIGVSNSQRPSDLVWYGRHGVNTAYFRRNVGCWLSGIYVAMKLYLTKDVGNDVNVHSYEFRYVPRGVLR